MGEKSVCVGFEFICDGWFHWVVLRHVFIAFLFHLVVLLFDVCCYYFFIYIIDLSKYLQYISCFLTKSLLRCKTLVKIFPNTAISSISNNSMKSNWNATNPSPKIAITLLYQHRHPRVRLPSSNWPL